MPIGIIRRTSLWGARHKGFAVPGALLLLTCLFGTERLVTALVADVHSGPAPFVLETEIYSFAKPPRGDLVSKATEARRSDGTMATVATSFVAGRSLMTRSIYYPDGRQLRLMDAISAKTTWPAPPASESAAMRERDLRLAHNNCAEQWEAFLRFETLFGVRFAVVKTVPVNVFGTTSWRSPELGCETLQYETETVSAGHVVLASKKRLVRFVWAEPDPKLFDEGTRYAELRPSKLLRKQVNIEGVLWNADLAKQAEAEDARYLKLKNNAGSPIHYESDASDGHR